MANTRNLVTPYDSPPINKFNNIYFLTLSDLNEFQTDVITQSGSSPVKLFQSYGDYIGSVKYFPFGLTYMFNQKTPSFLPTAKSSIKVGGVTLPNAKGYEVMGRSSRSGNYYDATKCLIGKFHITRQFNNFMDYGAYTKLRLWIPYFNYVELPTNEVMGQYIYIYTTIDITSGVMSVFVLKDSSSSISSNATLLFSMDKNIALDISISTNNATQFGIQQALNMASFGQNFQQGKINPSSIGGLVGAKFETEYKPVGKTFNSDIYAPQECFIERIRVSPLSEYGSSYFKHLYGLPCNDYYSLGAFVGKGFVKVADCHLEGFKTATSEELDEIMGILKNGIVL